MFVKSAMTGLVALSFVACSDTNDSAPVDLARPINVLTGDMAVNPANILDMAVQLNYTAATINGIDTAPATAAR